MPTCQGHTQTTDAQLSHAQFELEQQQQQQNQQQQQLQQQSNIIRYKKFDELQAYHYPMVPKGTCLVCNEIGHRVSDCPQASEQQRKCTDFRKLNTLTGPDDEKCSECTYTSKYKNIMQKHRKNAHGISSIRPSYSRALNMAPNSSRGTERLAESSSRNAPLKLALPKPVSSAPLFAAYSESSRLNDDDIQGTLTTYLQKLGLNSGRRGNLNFYYFAGT